VTSEILAQQHHRAAYRHDQQGEAAKRCVQLRELGGAMLSFGSSACARVEQVCECRGLAVLKIVRMSQRLWGRYIPSGASSIRDVENTSETILTVLKI
jgi:hypothetical protein